MSLSRYSRFRHRIFMEQYARILHSLKKDKHFPRTLESCFRRLGLNPDSVVEKVLVLSGNHQMNYDSALHELVWLLIQLGYTLGKHSKRRSHRIKPLILRFPRLK